MIISHKHRYVFIELPLTGSSAIARELRLNYSGERVLDKHSHYGEFAKWASGPEFEYFKFSGVRNPVDLVFSEYVKYKMDHRGRFSAGRSTKYGRMRKYVTRHRDKTRYEFILQKDADFGSYLRRFYRLPYSNWSALWDHQLDYIYRFEHISEEFNTILHRIGIDPVRPLPQRNTTSGKGAGAFSALTDRRDIEHARWVFRPFMKRWGYRLPPHWDEVPNQRWNDTSYAVAHRLRSVYWKYMR